MWLQGGTVWPSQDVVAPGKCMAALRLDMLAKRMAALRLVMPPIFKQGRRLLPHAVVSLMEIGGQTTSNTKGNSR